jgi:hypothetical protein
MILLGAIFDIKVFWTAMTLSLKSSLIGKFAPSINSME